MIFPPRIDIPQGHHRKKQKTNSLHFIAILPSCQAKETRIPIFQHVFLAAILTPCNPSMQTCYVPSPDCHDSDPPLSAHPPKVPWRHHLDLARVWIHKRKKGAQVTSVWLHGMERITTKVWLLIFKTLIPQTCGFDYARWWKRHLISFTSHLLNENAQLHLPTTTNLEIIPVRRGCYFLGSRSVNLTGMFAPEISEKISLDQEAMAGLVKASLSKRSPKALSVIYLPSFPASGESFTEARTAKIGGSIGWHSTGGTLDRAIARFYIMGIGSLKQDAWSTNILQVASKQYSVHNLRSYFGNIALIGFIGNITRTAARRLPTLKTMDRGYQNHPQTPKSQPPFPFNPGENHQDTFEWETKVCVHLGMKPVTLMETMSPALALFTASRVTPRTTVISLEFLRFFHPFPQSQSTQKHRKGQKT